MMVEESGRHHQKQTTPLALPSVVADGSGFTHSPSWQIGTETAAVTSPLAQVIINTNPIRDRRPRNEQHIQIDACVRIEN
jgi:hypothetical protein